MCTLIPLVNTSNNSISYSLLLMYLKSIALFVAVYGRGALAALPASCQEDDSTCPDCTPLNTEYQPDGVGELYYSNCCTESETSSADPPVTTTKQYCYTYVLAGWPNNQYSGNKPSTCGTGNIGWSLEGQCTTVTDSVSSSSISFAIYSIYISTNSATNAFVSSHQLSSPSISSSGESLLHRTNGVEPRRVPWRI